MTLCGAVTRNRARAAQTRSPTARTTTSSRTSTKWTKTKTNRGHNPMRADEKSTADVTGDVGSEGGTPGDVEIAHRPEPATGSEADETWRPADDRPETVVRDETGEGRRSP